MQPNLLGWSVGNRCQFFIFLYSFYFQTYKCSIMYIVHEDRVRIGNRIKEIRVKRGLDARDLAHLVGIDASNLSRIENGRYSVGLDILAKIATALGKKVDFVDIDK